jgi:hypothetical protein
MVINNNAKFDPIVELLLGGEGCEIKHVFMWVLKKVSKLKFPIL